MSAKLDTHMSDALWYFGGESQGKPLPTVVTAAVGSSSSGLFDWQVLEGSNKVALGDGAGADRVVVRDDNRILVRSIARAGALMTCGSVLPT
jgi:hypothetical protein